MSRIERVWKFQCQVCGLDKEQGSEPVLACVDLDNGDIAQVNACSKCYRDIKKYRDDQSYERAGLEAKKTPKRIDRSDEDFPPPTPREPEQPQVKMNDLAAALVSIAEGQKEIIGLLQNGQPQQTKRSRKS